MKPNDNSEAEKAPAKMPSAVGPKLEAALKSFGAGSLPLLGVWEHVLACHDSVEKVESLGSAELLDLVLAYACAQHDTAAVSFFVTHYADALREAAARILKNGDDIDECVQAVRVKLLVGGTDGSPRMNSYLGRGSLRGWVQVVTVRHAISMKRKPAAKHTGENDAELAEMLSTGDTELDAFRARYLTEFREAFRAAMRNLAPDDSRVLREHVIDGLTVDDMARVHGVSRATTARWVCSAREELGKLVRRELTQKLKLSRDEFESIARLVRSQLDISYSALNS